VRNGPFGFIRGAFSHEESGDSPSKQREKATICSYAHKKPTTGGGVSVEKDPIIQSSDRDFPLDKLRKCQSSQFFLIPERGMYFTAALFGELFLERN